MLKKHLYLSKYNNTPVLLPVTLIIDYNTMLSIALSNAVA